VYIISSKSIWISFGCKLKFLSVQATFNAPQDERCIKYAEYLVENYVTTDSRYPSMLWSIIQSGNLASTIYLYKLAKLCNGIVSSVSFALSRHRWLCRTLDLHICDWLEFLDPVYRNLVKMYIMLLNWWIHNQNWSMLILSLRCTQFLTMCFLLQIWNAVGFIWGKRGTAKCKILVWVKTTRIVTVKSVTLSRHRWLCRTSDLHICDWLEFLDNVQKIKYRRVSWIKLCIEMRMK
jgi:hypothetical protein